MNHEAISHLQLYLTRYDTCCLPNAVRHVRPGVPYHGIACVYRPRGAAWRASGVPGADCGHSGWSLVTRLRGTPVYPVSGLRRALETR